MAEGNHRTYKCQMLETDLYSAIKSEDTLTQNDQCLTILKLRKIKPKSNLNDNKSTTSPGMIFIIVLHSFVIKN